MSKPNDSRALRRGLLVVDVQPTFCEGGALGVEGGNDVAERIASYIRDRGDAYEVIVTTQDWHIDPGEHFSDDPDFVDTWPPHGVAGTPEAELHPALDGIDFDVSVRKGAYEAAYSGFEGTTAEGRSLAWVLERWDIDAVDIVGLAESHCVKATAIDARQLDLATRVFSNLTAPVSQELGELAREAMLSKGVHLEEAAVSR